MRQDREVLVAEVLELALALVGKLGDGAGDRVVQAEVERLDIELRKQQRLARARRAKEPFRNQWRV